MRIVIDARLYGLENSGIGRYLINLIKNLQSLDTKDEYVILLRKKYFKKLNLNKNWQKVLVDIQHYSFSEQFRMPFVLNRIKADLVHFPHFNIPFFWRGRFVVTIHDMTMHFQGLDATKLPLPVYLLKRIPYKLILRKAVKEAKKVIVPTRVVKKDVVEYYRVDGEKVEVVYEGASVLKNSPSGVLKKYKLDGREYFLYVGATYPHKNLKKLIDALVQLNKEREGIFYLAISSSRNSFTKSLEKYTEKKGARGLVKFLGFVPDEDLKALYRGSLAFVYPSLSEGFGLQGLEAISSGTLLVSSNISVLKEVYGDAANYFDPKSVESVALSLNMMADMGKKEREEKLKSSRKILEKYSWEKMAKKTLDMYRQT